MNTKKIIILFAVWGSVILLFKWFSSEMIALFTPFLIIVPFGLIFIWSVAFGIWSLVIFIIRIKKERFKSVIPLTIFFVVSFLCLFVSFEMPKVKLEYILYTEKREEIVSFIQKGELTDDGIGNVGLPFMYKYLSCDGEAHIYKNNEQETVIGFWVYRGMMSSYQTVVYTSLAEPITSSVLGNSDIEIQKLEKLDENWYYVVAY